MKSTKIITSLTISLALAVTLGACSTDPNQTVAVTPAPSVVATTPAAEPTAEAVLAPEVAVPGIGTTITTEAEAAAAGSAGLGVYVTTAGSQVVIDPTAPTAQVILDDAKATGGATSPATTSAGGVEADARIAVAARAADAGGKKLVFVVGSGQYDIDGNLEKVLYAVQSASPEIRGRGSNAETIDGAIAIAQERIAAQSDPTQYELVVLAG